MTFIEENKHIQAIFNCMTNNTESPVIQEMIRGEVRNILDEARRTDPVKQQMYKALKVAKADMEEYHQSIGYDEDCEPYNIVCEAIKAAEGEE